MNEIKIDSNGILVALRAMREMLRPGRVDLWIECDDSGQVQYNAVWNSPVGMYCRMSDSPMEAANRLMVDAQSDGLRDEAKRRLAELDEKRAALAAVIK